MERSVISKMKAAGIVCLMACLTACVNQKQPSPPSRDQAVSCASFYPYLGRHSSPAVIAAIKKDAFGRLRLKNDRPYVICWSLKRNPWNASHVMFCQGEQIGDDELYLLADERGEVLRFWYQPRILPHPKDLDV